MQPNLYGGNVMQAYDRWLRDIPAEYAQFVLERPRPESLAVEEDPFCLKVLKHYRSLMSLAQVARKPIFKLTAADGAIGAHSQAARQVGAEFGGLAQVVVDRIGAAA